MLNARLPLRRLSPIDERAEGASAQSVGRQPGGMSIAASLLLSACANLPSYAPCDDAHPCALDRVCEDGACVRPPFTPEPEPDAAVIEPDAGPACLPTGDELCGDGRDNNCDGQTDEGFTYEGARIGEACDGVGECGLGTVVCVDGGHRVTCSTNPDGPGYVMGLETCDGLDNDCDGVVENGLTWNGVAMGAACLADTGCGAGTVLCGADGAPTCSTLGNAIDETCNGVDDNCDGQVDEGLTWNGLALGADCAGEGACGAGTVECFNGLAVCSVNPDGSHSGVSDEICDLLDNNCDGRIDEGFFPDGAEVGGPCTTPGLCGEGHYVCGDTTHGVCSTAPGQPDSPAATEQCNHEDDDCDGVVDNGIVAPDGTPLGGVCRGVGRCPDGVYTCGEGGAVICSTLPPSPQAPVIAELCNGIDDDCDGVVDNGLNWNGVAVGGRCDPLGECGFGTVVCGADGQPICDTAPGGPHAGDTPEICDRADNNCDGQIDEGFDVGPTAIGVNCVAPGVCGAGHYDCRNDGQGTICDTAPGGLHDASHAEQCNGLDDNCDGQIDETFTTPEGLHVGDACDGVGACGAGVVECADDGLGVRCSSDPGGSAFVAGVEICNGLDDDCDGQIDEDDARECTPCAVDGGVGVCADGVFLCTAGRLTCVSQLPPAGSEHVCDGLDNDCDGRTDEADEVAGAAVGDQALALNRCGPRPAPGAADAGHCAAAPGDANPACGHWHPCVDPVCQSSCQTRAFTGQNDCEAACQNPAPEARSACLLGCRDQVTADETACLRACDPLDAVAIGYLCGGGGGGAACTPQCPAGYVQNGASCVPTGEVCNNGLDDDGDGIIDGVRTGPDPCAAAFTLGGVQFLANTCDPNNPAGCDDPAGAARIAAAGGLKPRDTCNASPCPTPVQLSYDFGLDREEVSLRAYLTCVQNGCCQPASGGLYKRAEQYLNMHPNTRRPADESHDRCAPPPDMAAPGADTKLLDLPVTGVSWCQARDFCHWAGKRLATSTELSLAATGTAPIRRSPWGDAGVPTCEAEQACKGAGCAAGDPTCANLPPCPLDAQPPAGQNRRNACMAHAPGGDVACGEAESIPTPVWGNADGVSPEGVLNLTGNVAEWAFNWVAPDLNTAGGADPVGPACGVDAFGRIARRAYHGQTPSDGADRLHGHARNGLSPVVREPFLGFRCARTEEPTGGRCTDDIPDVRDAAGQCHPPALPNGVAETACGPSFEAVAGSALDTATCGGARDETTTCASQLPSVCPVAGGPGCGAFALDRLRLDTATLPGVDAEAADAFDGLFDLALAPNGGDTYVLLDAVPDFGRVDGLTASSLGSALAVGNRLAWVGTLSGIRCAANDRSSGLILRSAAGQLAPVCGEPRAGEILGSEIATRLHYSGLALALVYTADTDRLDGTASLLVSRADAAVSRIGGETFDDFATRVDLAPANLCQPAAHPIAAACAAAPAILLPGCDAAGVCNDPQTCTGHVLPVSLGSVRLSRALTDGRLSATLTCP